MHLLDLHNAEMGRFRVRLLRRGEPYGLQHQLRWDKDEPLVELYGAGESEFTEDTFRGRWSARDFLRPVAGWRSLEWGGVCLLSEDNQREIAAWLERLLAEPWTPPPPPPRPASQQREFPIDLHHAGDRRATIYFSGLIGYSPQEVDWVQAYRKPHAQYLDALFVEFRPRGKRRDRRVVLGSRLDLVILLGWDHPPLQEMYIADATGKRTKYFSGDKRYEAEFEAALHAYLDRSPLTRVLLDLRGETATERTEYRTGTAPVPVLYRSGEVVRADRPDTTAGDRTSVFVSYYHLGNAADRDRFERETGTAIRSISIYPGEISPERPDDAIRREIRARISRCEYLVVLVGRDTHTRRWVDWELRAALTGAEPGSHKPVLGVLLPEVAALADLVAPHAGTAAGDRPAVLRRKSDELSARMLAACGTTLPPRLLDNLLTGYAALSQWPASAEALVGALRGAVRTDRKPANSRRTMQQDLASSGTSPVVTPAADPPQPAAPAAPEPSRTTATPAPEPMTGATVETVLAGLDGSWRFLVDRHSHVLDPLESPASIAATLASRLTGDGWADGADELRAALQSQVIRNQPHLVPDEPLPDLPPPAQLRVLHRGAGSSNALVVAPGGDWLAAADRSGTIGVWDARSGVPLHPPGPGGHRITALVPASDGTWLAAAHEDGEVSVRNPATGTVLHTLRTTYGAARAVATDPAGTWLAAVDAIGTVHIWDMPAATLRHTRRHTAGYPRALVPGPGGAWLAASSWSTVRRWNPVTGDELPSLDAPRLAVDVMAVDPAGRWAAGAGDSGSGTIRLWDLTGTGGSRDLINRARTTDKGVVALVAGPGGRWMAAASRNGTIQIWDPVAGTRQRTLAGAPGINALTADPHGTWLASGGADGVVQVWDLSTGALRHTLTGHSGAVNALVADPAGAWLASTGDDGTVRVWDPAAPPARHRTHGRGPVRALTAAGDGAWSAWLDGAGDLHINGRDRHYRRPAGDGRLLLADPRGTWLASAGRDGMIRIWDPGRGVERLFLFGRAHQHHPDKASHLATDAAGQLLAAGGDRITLWSPTAGEKLDTLPAPGGGIRALAVGPDCTWLAAGGKDGTVEIRGLPDGAVRHRIPAHHGTVRVLIAGAFLFSGGADGVLRAWDPDTGAERRTWSGHAPMQHGGVTAVAVDPAGRWTASGGRDGMVRVWKWEPGAAPHLLTGHRGPVHAVAAAPGGRHLASVGEDGTVRVWDPVAGTAVASLRVAGGLHQVVWTPLGLIAGGDQGRYTFGLRP